MTAHRSEYDTVPDAADVREVDPHWQQLQRPGVLPSAYLPPAMPGRQGPWRRAVAAALLVLLLSATAGGVCLTYGPAELFALLDPAR